MNKEIIELDKLIKDFGKRIPPKIRIFLVRDDGYVYLNNGSRSSSHTAFGMYSYLRKERGEVLNAFTNFEFLIRELVRMKIISPEFKDNPYLLDLIDRPNISTLITLIFKWKLVAKGTKAKLENLFSVRNQLAHKFGINEVKYM